jgi:hypothetical protein
MFKWYRNSAVCYVYLADVTGITDAMLCDFYMGGPNMLYVHNLISCSRWLRRGWTLQELVAPDDVEFFSAEWKNLGTRSGLEVLLSQKTGIPRTVLAGESLSAYPAAEKMSWASERTTTREEDMAYCMLGIFDVHMPLLYGEGNRAFVRLQEEILKRSEDLSLLAWTLQIRSPHRGHQRRSVLARHPAAFGRPQLTKSTLDTIPPNPNWSPFVFSVQRNKLGLSQNTKQQLRFPPPVVTNRGILTTLLLSPDSSPDRPADPTVPASKPQLSAGWSRQNFFAWTFSTALLEIFDQGMEKHRSLCMIGISLEIDVELPNSFQEQDENPAIVLRETLLSSDKPLMAWRSRNWDLLCLDIDPDNFSRLVPRQVYLSLDEDQGLTSHAYGLHSKEDDTPLPAPKDMDDPFFKGADTFRLRFQYKSTPALLLTGTTHALYYRRSITSNHLTEPGQIDNTQPLSTIRLGAKLTVIVLPCVHRDVSDGLTGIGMFTLGVLCQQTDADGKAREVGSELNVELGLVRTYSQGARRMRGAMTTPSQTASASQYRDRSYVRLECGHVSAVVVKGSWGGAEKEDWVIQPSLEVTFS